MATIRFIVGDRVAIAESIPEHAHVRKGETGTITYKSSFVYTVEMDSDRRRLDLDDSHLIAAKDQTLPKTYNPKYYLLYTRDGSLKIKEFNTDKARSRFIGGHVVAHLNDTDSYSINAVFEGEITAMSSLLKDNEEQNENE